MKKFILGFILGVAVGVIISPFIYQHNPKQGKVTKEYLPSKEKDSSVHAIGVYEGDYPDGNTHSFSNHPNGRIDVYVKENPENDFVVLLLMSYEPVTWNIVVEGNVKVKKIIISSYTQGSIVSGVSGIPVLRVNLGYSYTPEGILAMSERTKAFTGGNIKTAQGGYHGKIFDIF